MKVYKIGIGVEVPRGEGTRQILAALCYCDEKDARFFVNDYMGKPYTRKWKPVRFYIDKPRLPRPDFFAMGGGWICNERAMQLAGEAMEMAGEYLPVEIEDEPGSYQFYHITNCSNVLDPEKSQWHILESSKFDKGNVGTMKELVMPVFRKERFGEESLFKIPEDFGTRSYCLERSDDPDDGEFKAVVDRQGLTGLRFDLVWSDEAVAI